MESCRAKVGRETGYDRHYGDMHAAMRGQGITSTSGRDASTRAVEAGSRLVSAPAGATFCVLQMPRGNLEVVSPRALVLAAIAEAILVSPAAPPCVLLETSSSYWSPSGSSANIDAQTFELSTEI